MRQNGHGAITIEDVRTWIEETGLCIFLPRSAQAGFTAPTFVEAIAGQRTTEPSQELIATAESLLVRLEAEGVAVRLNLGGHPLNQAGDQPDYIVAGWVLPYIYALRGDRDWRRSPQLTGSRQVSQLAVLAAKQIDTGNLTSMQIRDALGREVTETAVLRALHELWKQLRIIPVVPEVDQPALWQPLRQRFQKAIAEGASTSQVTAISVLASIYLQAVIAASMEDVEMFLSPLTSRSKIREVVRGLAATRQVHSTTMGHSPMFYVAGTLPEFPAVPSYQISNTYSSYRNNNYRGSTYLGSDPDQSHDDDFSGISQPIYARAATRTSSTVQSVVEVETEVEAILDVAASAAVSPRVDRVESEVDSIAPHVSSVRAARPAPVSQVNAKPAAPRPRSPRPNAPRSTSARSANPAHARDSRDRSRGASAAGDTRNSDRRRAPAPRGTASNGSRNAAGARSHSNGSNGAKAVNGNGTHAAKPANKGWAAKAPAHSNGNGNGHGNGAKTSAAKPASSARPASRSAAAAPRAGGRTTSSKPVAAGAAKRYSFSGQAKQAPKPAASRSNSTRSAGAARSASSKSRPADAKRRG
jgi:hypothetical protein